MTARKKVIDEIKRIASSLANKSYHPAQHLSPEPTRGRAKRTLDKDALDGNIYAVREAILASREIVIERIIRHPDGGLTIEVFASGKE